jgi:hypothetical protein
MDGVPVLTVRRRDHRPRQEGDFLPPKPRLDREQKDGPVPGWVTPLKFNRIDSTLLVMGRSSVSLADHRVQLKLGRLLARLARVWRSLYAEPMHVAND